MALKNRFYLLSLTIIMGSLYGSPQTLQTKIDVSKILYLSSDGKNTYYQNHDGVLFHSTNYHVEKILKQPEGTKYNVHVTHNKKRTIVTSDTSYLKNFSPIKPLPIYASSFGKKEQQLIAKGVSPKLHQQDEWLSYHEPELNQIVLKNLSNTELQYTIQLQEHLNPYFSPAVVIVDLNTVLYTDQDSQGISYLKLLELEKKKKRNLYKTKSPTRSLQLCRLNKKAYLGDFSLDSLDTGTAILSLDLQKEPLDFESNIYGSKSNDLGQLLCSNGQNKVYWIKNKDSQGIVLEYDPSKKKTTSLFKETNITNIFEMDKKILSFNEGKYLVIKGDHDMTKQDLLLKD